MTASEIRRRFLDFFAAKGHQLVPSAPIVIKNDPTLMFTNAGMNQFKDWFLGNSPAQWPRVADTQKCLRVSGKHNDLEEVGLDTYHHTMFEMLGNWSFGDYFKKDAIAWAWELLTSSEGFQLPKDRLYVTVFEGDDKENLAFDREAWDIWTTFVPESQILRGNKKDNFWEMGDTGPCGPCSEIHFDSRSDEERAKTSGASLVNQDHPQVIEIWNLVFMEFNRKADQSLEKLPNQHVDTGMGFERLCRVIQGKQSNYDTDVFQPLIQALEKKSGIRYQGTDEGKSDIAMRVIADHVRAVGFAIADGQLPSNTGAGYVIRRILRRAVRYGFSFLDRKQPFIYELVEVLAREMGPFFPEMKSQQAFVQQVIKEEEAAFLHTLENGMAILHDILGQSSQGTIPGEQAFHLYDTHGFPPDLTALIARERGWNVDEEGFQKAMESQKNRSRKAAASEMGDWVELSPIEESKFVGYDEIKNTTRIARYRQITQKGKSLYQIVLEETPFYAESGGQVGDTGVLVHGDEVIQILDTKKENNLFIHLTEKLPEQLSQLWFAEIDNPRREDIMANHSATHLLQTALRTVLGNHVQQKGSLVHPDYLRFDFSHFSKVTEDELKTISAYVNQDIQRQFPLQVYQNIPIEEAMEMGATALFGEKYGTHVRVISFGGNHSMELCGGTHVANTRDIGLFIITSESSVAAGVRRIEALTGRKAIEYLQSKANLLDQVAQYLNHPKDVLQALKSQHEELESLRLKADTWVKKETEELKTILAQQFTEEKGMQILFKEITVSSADIVKNLSFQLGQNKENTCILLGTVVDGKPLLSLMLSEDLVKSRNLNAGKIIKQAAQKIKGGGGGQPFYATAGGSAPEGLAKALEEAKALLTQTS